MTPEEYNEQVARTLARYDEAVVALVKKAQKELGVPQDGKLGPNTIALLVGKPDVPTVVGRRAKALAKAKTQVGKGKYGLGKGGKKVGTPDPFENGFCDCSGFLAWCFELPRQSADGVWFFTDQLEADAKGQVKGDLGDGVAWDKALPGDVLVYGAGSAVGHCGIVSEVGPNGPTKVIHCNAGAPPAVDETATDFFRKKGAVVLRIRD